VVAGYVVVRSLINHPALLAAGFRWANFDFRSGIRLSWAYYTSLYYIYCLLEPVGAGRSMRRCCSRRPVQMTTTGDPLWEAPMLFTTRRSGAVKAAPTHREPTLTHTVTGNVFFTLTKLKKNECTRVWWKIWFETYTWFKYFSNFPWDKKYYIIYLLICIRYNIIGRDFIYSFEKCSWIPFKMILFSSII